MIPDYFSQVQKALEYINLGQFNNPTVCNFVMGEELSPEIFNYLVHDLITSGYNHLYVTLDVQTKQLSIPTEVDPLEELGQDEFKQIHFKIVLKHNTQYQGPITLTIYRS